jgi:hypothetical protein
MRKRKTEGNRPLGRYNIHGRILKQIFKKRRIKWLGLDLSRSEWEQTDDYSEHGTVAGNFVTS